MASVSLPSARKISCPDPYADNDDFFANSIGLSADGNTLAVGAFGESSAFGSDASDDSLRNAGAAYVFSRGASGWTQTAYIKPSRPNAGNNFGDALALSADGNTLAVGAYLESSDSVGVGAPGTNNYRSGSGAVYLFTRLNEAWTEQAFLKASNPDADDQFGKVLRVSADGNTLAVAAYQEDGGTSTAGTDNSARESGAVYVFGRSGSAWSQQAYLKATTPSPGASFGWALALSGSATALAVAEMTGDGNVYVFDRLGNAWTPRPVLVSPNPDPDSGDMFGFSLAFSDDASVLAVGAAGEDSTARAVNGDATDNSAKDAGAAYVFTYQR